MNKSLDIDGVDLASDATDADVIVIPLSLLMELFALYVDELEDVGE